MLGRVMMPIGTASCTACNTRFIISPSPSGLPYGLPFGREHFVVVERQNTAWQFTRHAETLPLVEADVCRDGTPVPSATWVAKYHPRSRRTARERRPYTAWLSFPPLRKREERN